MNDINILTELSPTSASIVDQTDEILNGDKKRKLNTDIENIATDLGLNFDDTKETYRTAVDSPEIKEDIVLEKKVDDKNLYAYGVYQIEAGGKDLFSKIEGDEDSIMGLPVKKIKEYLSKLKC